MFENFDDRCRGEAAWFLRAHQNLDHMSNFPNAEKRLHSARRVEPDSARVPSARGLIFDISADDSVSLADFHATPNSGFNIPFIASFAGVNLPPSPDAAPTARPGHYRDLVLVSDIVLGCRLNAPVHTHSVFNHHLLSLAKHQHSIE